MFKFNLGDDVKDSITGFKGAVVVLAEFLTGCKRIGVQSREMKDGKPVEWTMFDEDQLVLVKKKKDDGRDYLAFEFALGDEVKDKITGYSGVVTCRARYLSGSKRINVQCKKLKGGQPIDPVTFDEEQLVSLKKKFEHKVKTPAGPQRFEENLRR
jgi:heat shock protein HspQ